MADSNSKNGAKTAEIKEDSTKPEKQKQKSRKTGKDNSENIKNSENSENSQNYKELKFEEEFANIYKHLTQNKKAKELKERNNVTISITLEPKQYTFLKGIVEYDDNFKSVSHLLRYLIDNYYKTLNIEAEKALNKEGLKDGNNNPWFK